MSDKPEQTPGPTIVEPQLLRTPGGAEFLVPPTPPPGEMSPPGGVQSTVLLTDADVKGRRYVMLQLTDDTITVQVRMPWQVAGQFGQGLAQQLAQAQQAAEGVAGPRLLVPGQDFPPGAMPPPNLPAQANGGERLRKRKGLR